MTVVFIGFFDHHKLVVTVKHFEKIQRRKYVIVIINTLIRKLLETNLIQKLNGKN